MNRKRAHYIEHVKGNTNGFNHRMVQNVLKESTYKREDEQEYLDTFKRQDISGRIPIWGFDLGWPFLLFETWDNTISHVLSYRDLDSLFLYVKASV